MPNLSQLPNSFCIISGIERPSNAIIVRSNISLKFLPNPISRRNVTRDSRRGLLILGRNKIRITQVPESINPAILHSNNVGEIEYRIKGRETNTSDPIRKQKKMDKDTTFGFRALEAMFFINGNLLYESIK